jgi:hypothetical protein
MEKPAVGGCLLPAARLRSTENDQRPADRCLLIAAGHPPFRFITSEMLLRYRVVPKPGGIDLRRVSLRENAGSHQQVAISRQPVVFS